MEAIRNINQNSSDTIDSDKLLMILRQNWMWIVFIFLFVNGGAYLFVRYTKNIYQSSSELKLDVTHAASELGIAGITEDPNLNLMSGEIEIVRSMLFLNRVLDHSDFEISFYSVGRVLTEELYGRPPAFVAYNNLSHNLYNYPIGFREVSEGKFQLQPGRAGNWIDGAYGRKIVLDGNLELILERNPDFIEGDEVGYYFLIHSRDVLLQYLSRNLVAEPLNLNANTIRISFIDNNPYKAQAVLNKIDTLYLSYSNEQKNLANKQKIDWLTNELGQIERKMEDYETYFENFTLQNKTNNLNEDLKNTIQAINRIDSQRYDMTRKITAINELIDGLTTGQIAFTLTIRQYLPNYVVDKLDELQRAEIEQDRLRMSYNENTFTYKKKENQIATLRTSILRQLSELKVDWVSRVQDLNRKKSTLEIQFASLPDKNTEFTKNQRFYNLYEEFYLSLMQSKSEFEIAQAGSIPDFKILSPASLSLSPIAPKRMMIAGVGAVASLVLTLLFVGLLYVLNNKITGVYELERINVAPVLGSVPQSRYETKGLHIIEHPKSMVSEALRSLRTNLDFFNAANTKKVVAVSSTVSGEGKSFIAMNLGGVIALSKKKVVLVDLDMRKTKSNTPVNGTDHTKGVSTILIRKNSWKECLKNTSLENFDYIESGPHPPNPSELLLNGEFSELLDNLKKEYDYIILDTPPVGLVTDGIMAMRRADISLYVFRANYSKKEFMRNLQRLISINKFTNITTILNAIPTSSKSYGYGYYEDNGKPNRLKSLFKS